MALLLYAYENGTQTPLNVVAALHNRTLKCFEYKCSPVTLLHLSNLKYSQYFVKVSLCNMLFNFRVVFVIGVPIYRETRIVILIFRIRSSFIIYWYL